MSCRPGQHHDLAVAARERRNAELVRQRVQQLVALVEEVGDVAAAADDVLSCLLMLARSSSDWLMLATLPAMPWSAAWTLVADGRGEVVQRARDALGGADHRNAG
jgi:hypothetical protein